MNYGGEQGRIVWFLFEIIHDQLTVEVAFPKASMEGKSLAAQRGVAEPGAVG